MPIVATDQVSKAAHLDHHIGAGGHRGDSLLPIGEHLFAPGGIEAGAQRTTDVIQDNGGIGECGGQVSQLAQLGVVHQGIEAQAQLLKAGEPFPEPGIQQHPRRGAH